MKANPASLVPARLLSQTGCHRRFALILLVILLFPGLTGLICSNPATVTPGPAVTALPSETPLPQAMITFRVQLPDPIADGESIQLEILDEVTGLGLNSQVFPMDKEDSLHFIKILPLSMNTIFKYRYSHKGSASTALEHVSDGRSVRYRLYHVEGPGLVQDVVSRWADTPFKGPSGRINGRITDAQTGAAIPNVMVAAGGAQTLTASDGSYLLEGLPPGTHMVVAYSLDGAYQTYQQGAVVAADATTPAPLRLNPAKMVKIVFTITAPKGTLPAIPLRLAGNLYQLGNTFADLTGGSNNLAARMPVLSPLPDGRYTITLELPVGADIRYKYTLGDGIWNAEQTTKGSYRLRQLIVPNSTELIEDRVDSWSSGKSAPITFDITVPANTPASDFVSIQFHPTTGWTEPLPMWSVGGNRWIYVLYSPLETLGPLGFRYCRNGQCGSADDAKTMGFDISGQSVSTSLLPETIDNPVTSWAWLGTSDDPITLPNIQLNPRDNHFMAGIEFEAAYHPSWQTLINNALGDVSSLSANWLILTPTWSFTRANLPVLEPVPGHDPLWPDTLDQISQSKAKSLNVALFPTPSFPGGSEAWWKSAKRDFGWWNAWFERYRTFLINYADLAEQSGAEALILGGDWLNPALPEGKLEDGNASGVPEDATARWHDILVTLKQHYKGTLIWAVTYPSGVKNPPPFMGDIDAIYVLWNAPLADKKGASVETMAIAAGQALDNDLKPLQALVEKPVFLGLAYPSAKGGSTGCLVNGDGCMKLSVLDRPNPDVSNIDLDLQDQVSAYSAMLLAVNERDWISGVVSRGYYPPADLQDKSISIHGKPARGVLWYWFPRLLGITPP